MVKMPTRNEVSSYVSKKGCCLGVAFWRGVQMCKTPFLDHILYLSKENKTDMINHKFCIVYVRFMYNCSLHGQF